MGPGDDREVDPRRVRRRWGTARVSGESMRPTLSPGDLLLIRYRAQPRIGRLVVVRLPARGLAVKRVTRRDPEGWWVERDNRAAGVDSWLVGAIPDADVVAVVVCRLWPVRARPTLHRS